MSDYVAPVQKRAAIFEARFFSWAGSLLIILLALFCVLGALTSAFDFSVSTAGILPVWAIAAVALSALVTLFRLKGLLIFLPPALVVLYYRFPEIQQGAKTLIFILTNEFNKYLGIKVLFQGVVSSAQERTAFFAALGVAIMIPLSAAVCLRRSCVATILITLPFVLPTVALNDSPPNPVYLVGLMAIYLTLLLSSAFHPDDYEKRKRAVVSALALAAVLLGVAYLVAPGKDYNKGEIITGFERRIRRLTSKKSGIPIPGTGWPQIAVAGGWSFDTDTVEVAAAGSRAITNEELLNVVSTRAGTFYLRGYSMRLFDGRAWYQNADAQIQREEEAMRTPARIAQLYQTLLPDGVRGDASMLVIISADSSNLRYMPYYTLESVHAESTQGRVINDSTVAAGGDDWTVITDRSKFFFSPSDIPKAAAELPPGVFKPDLAGYNLAAQLFFTQIDTTTAAKLKQLAAQAGIEAGADRAETTEKVAMYISSSAQYSLSPPVTPEKEEFTLYFLQTAREGYCIHFATAATMMLRALEIPARFTCGFVVDIAESDVGKAVSVTDSGAHAWVEVYYDDIGWIPLEVSPASPVGELPSRTPYVSVEAENPEDEMAPERYDPMRELMEQMQRELEMSQQNSAGAGAGGGRGVGRNVNRPMVALISAAALIAVILLRRWAQRGRRQRLFMQVDTNEAVISVWKYITRLQRKAPQPEEIEDIALKARFSAHKLTEEERGEAVRYAEAASEDKRLRSKFFERLYLKYVLALI